MDGDGVSEGVGSEGEDRESGEASQARRNNYLAVQHVRSRRRAFHRWRPEYMKVAGNHGPRRAMQQGSGETVGVVLNLGYCIFEQPEGGRKVPFPHPCNAPR